MRLGSVFRTVLLSLRTLLIWSANLAVFYASGGGAVGEGWDHVASPIQCAGFALLLAGTLLYARGNATTSAAAAKTAEVAGGGAWHAIPTCSSPDGKCAARHGAREAAAHAFAVLQPPERAPTGGEPAGAVRIECAPLLGGWEAREAASAAPACTGQGWPPLLGPGGHRGRPRLAAE